MIFQNHVMVTKQTNKYKNTKDRPIPSKKKSKNNSKLVKRNECLL